MTTYRKGVLIGGILAIALGVLFSMVSIAYRPPDLSQLLALTGLALATNVVALLLASRIFPAAFPTRGELAEAMVAQLLLFLVAWSAVYNILR